VGRPTKYPDEFRRDAVALVRSSGRPINEVAKSLGMNKNTLWNWCQLDKKQTDRVADPNRLSESRPMSCVGCGKRWWSSARTKRF
jgi:transposase-like protein